MDKQNSVTTLANVNSKSESHSIEENDNLIESIFLRNLNDSYLNALHAIFKEKCYKTYPKNENVEIGLTKEEFVNAFEEVFGDSKYTSEAIEIFNEIDVDETLQVKWEKFLNFIEKQLHKKIEPKMFIGDPKILQSPHLKREAINKIVPLETKKYFSYALISKHGCVGLYDGNMNFLLSYTVIMSKEDVERTDGERRKKNRWITDAIFAPNLQMFIITSSARSLTIYDASNLHHIPIWLILGSPSIFTSVDIVETRSNNKPILYAGNEYGQIVSIEFQQTDSCLFRKKHNDKMTLFYWAELQDEKEFVVIKNSGKIHNSVINDIRYYEKISTMLTCSKDPKNSVTLATKIKRYVFKFKYGANCCSLSYKLKLLLTGSEDGTVRAWNIFVTKQATQRVKFHKSGVVDVVILENQIASLSCSRDGFLILMDLKEFNVLQSISINFPSFNEPGKIIEWGRNSLCPGPKRSSSNDIDCTWERTNILITCCNNVASLDLHFFDEKERKFDFPVLPPPPLQNSVLIPSNWRISEEIPESEYEISDCDEKTMDYIKTLKFILDRDLVGDDNRNEINFQISRLETKKLEMKDAVAQGAPYLALDLPVIEELQLSPNLPVPDVKRTKKLVEKTHRLLSAASSRSAIFSSPSPSSSSRSRSNRSSVTEFN